MDKKVKLKDYSFYMDDTAIENKKLYTACKNNSVLILDTSICDVVGDKNDTKPIMEIKRGAAENSVEIITFGYVGRFSHLGVEFDITYRFGNIVLDRMINKVNDFDVKTFASELTSIESQSDSLAMKILYMNFILKLEKLSILGLPKSYERIEHHDDKFKGQLDINRFIKKDIPFQGKISSVSYEQLYVQEIVDVLYNALQIVEKSMYAQLASLRLFQIRNLIYHHSNRRFIDGITIENAIYHKSIQNSLYDDFKQLLEMSGYIIRYQNKLTYKSNNILNGLIFDVSLLWESYLYKLLKENIEDDSWEVVHEEPIEVYGDKFYARNMYPDIVIKNEKDKKVIVLDAKSKSMLFRGTKEGIWDLDRDDFFQINTYMSYYQNQGYEVIAGGLLYPIQKDYESNKNLCNSENWFGDNNNTQFIVDGIDLSKLDKEDFNIIDSEQEFIDRIKNLIKQA